MPDKSEAAAVIEGIKSAHDVDRLIADYISGLLDHVLATVKESLDEASIDAIPVKFIVTVPAIWTERSSERTVRALRQAPNFPSRGSISVVSEPEAAAIYTLHKTDRHDLHVGDCFLVVDAGGGTVDLISYVVSSLYPVLEVTEAAPGSGGMCGSQFLNGRFQQFLDGKLGKESNYDDEVRQAAMRHFELNVSLRVDGYLGFNSVLILPRQNANSVRMQYHIPHSLSRYQDWRRTETWGSSLVGE